MPDSEASARTCEHCGTALERIQLMPGDARGPSYVPLHYAAWNAEPNWIGSVRADGVIEHWMCPRCRRVSWFISPFDRSSEVLPARPPAGEGSEITPSK